MGVLHSTCKNGMPLLVEFYRMRQSTQSCLFRNPSWTGKSGRNKFSSNDRLLMVKVYCPCLCACKPILWSYHRRGHIYGMPSPVLSSFGTRDFPTKRFSETTSACWKRQSFGGKFILSWENLRRSSYNTNIRALSKNDKHMLVGLCCFLVVLFYVKRK